MASNKEIVIAVLRETTLFYNASVSEYSSKCEVKIVTKADYLSCLVLYKNNASIHAGVCSDLARMCTPEWHCEEYYINMKRRLYTKNPEHYKQWDYLGTSFENWYWSQEENRFIKYVNGKRIE